MLSCIVHYHHTSAVLLLTDLILKSFPLQLIQIMVLSEQAGQGGEGEGRWRGRERGGRGKGEEEERGGRGEGEGRRRGGGGD